MVFEDKSILHERNDLSLDDNSLISALKIYSSFGQYKIDDIKYFHKYFSLVNAEFEIDQNEFDNVVSIESVLQIEKTFTGWFNQNKYDDLDKKLTHFFNIKQDQISADVLHTIDNTMASGTYSRHDIYFPIFRHLILYYDKNGESSRDYISSIHNSLDPNSSARNIAYFLVDNNFSNEKIDKIINAFKYLLDNNIFDDNQLFYFIQNFNSKISYLEMPIHQIEKIERYKILDSLNKKLHPLISAFAVLHIVEFLQNFSMPNMVNSSDPVYLIYDSLVPRLISYDEVLELLKKENQTDAIKELSDFINKLRESSIYAQGNS